jgi:hypothetical protein
MTVLESNKLANWQTGKLETGNWKTGKLENWPTGNWKTGQLATARNAFHPTFAFGTHRQKNYPPPPSKTAQKSHVKPQFRLTNTKQKT